MSRYHNYSSGFQFGSSVSSTVKKLIIINVSVFICQFLFDWLPWGLLAMTPSLVFKKLMLWQLFTYMFLHADIWHLFLNMLMLYFFGPMLEETWGKRQFLTYYFFTGVGAGLCSFFFSANASIIGASGSIFGLLVAFAMLFPETVVYVMFIIPMKIKYAVILFAGLNLWNAVFSTGGNVAYFAHLGGAFFGYLYLKSGRVRNFVSKVNLSGLKSWQKKKTRIKKDIRKKNIDQQVDQILDKISKHGIKSLTSQERRILEEKSKKT